MTRQKNDTQDENGSQAPFEMLVREKLQQAVRTALCTDLDQSIGEMFSGGVSMTRVGEVVETLTGTKPSASTVSRVFHTQDQRI